MAKEGFPFVLIPAIAALLLAFLGWWIAALLLAALAAFMAFFFRDPYRESPEGDGLIVSAADGKVTRIEENELGKVVSVFLSPIDVHINRSPIAGTVTKVNYVKGKKMPATSNDASHLNERNSLTLTNGDLTVVVTQIAGIVARRIVCWAKEGDELARGERFGLIKFSSRTDLLLPSNVELAVNIGDRVVGGVTIIARLPETAANAEVRA
jgi:phosphatidylserine decarboxylase